MLRKFILISVFALCATLYAYGPNWSSVSAQGTIPAAPAPVALPDDFADDFTGVTDPGVPTTSDDITFEDPGDTGGDGPTTPPATVETNPDGGTTVTLPVGFTNTSDEPLDDVILTAVVPDGQTLPDDSPWDVIGTDDDGNPIVAYGVGTLGPGESVQVPLVTNSDGPASDIAGTPITIPTRLDATDSEDNAISLAGSVEQTPQAPTDVQEPGEEVPTGGETPVSLPLPENISEILPESAGEAFPTEPITSDVVSLAPAPSDDDSSPSTPATVDGSTVTLPVGFTNSSSEALDNVVLTVQLGEGETLPDDSQWTEFTLSDGTRVAAFNLGSLAAGASAEIPFVFNSNNVAAGDPVALQTRLDATDAAGDAVALAGVVEQTPQAPTALNLTDEPAQDIHLFLPIISR